MAEQNLALNKPATSSSFVKPYEPARAVNGNLGTTTPTSRWLCNTLPGWLMVDLGLNGSSTYWINRWVVRHMPVAGWRAPDYNMSDFKLQGSNDKNAWYDIDSVVGNTVSITDRTLPLAVNYRYVRLYVTKGLKSNTKLASAMELEVYQSPPLSAYLVSGTGLTVSSGALNPAFVNTVFNYTTPNVPYNTTSVTVKPTAEDPRATIKVNGVVVPSGNTTNVALNVGSNSIVVVVNAADGRTTNTYTVTVVREQGAILTGLTVSSGTLNPTFASDVLAYTTGNVTYDTSSITVTPVSTIPGASITVNGAVAPSGQPATVNLNVGSNTINVVVTNGAASQTYTVTVLRASSPYLTNLTIAPALIKLSPSFSSSTLNYTTIPATVTSGTITLTPTAQDTNATINVAGTVVQSGSSKAITLSKGLNTINIVVNSAVGSDSKTYILQVTKS